MRIGFGLIAGSLALAWALGPTAARPPQSKPISPPSSASDLRLPPTNGVQQSSPLAGLSELSVEECKQVGGTVKADTAGFCSSGSYCATTDKDGKNHAACLSGNIW
jgi:putative hemolysin